MQASSQVFGVVGQNLFFGGQDFWF